ncbi:hypothetical protein [Saccharomonospora viridis]|jgi:hypothetical protein|uniref:Tryptophan-associated transmembrane protein (Trp_oprn_chp) n=2 Tax=Saccharomonospora viridis TaxID=1852 RepID=C7MXG9_SACVD|nr:hypothetical protein [Saccharomonospora viridis]ACU97248.1 hypothetical protein Svir_22400 [Saccharomonospora viridis DSM 43017]KHF43513.1 hypothetical protein MINT15_37150 [Saccharomonospora viridis]SFO77990.1 hypothetical protein SAMN02982918_0096 [Saccharomonospora viridis]
MRSWTTANPVTRGCVALTVLGLVTAVIGTFLPWLRSGNVHRDSHTAAAVIGQLLPSDTNVAVLLRAWNVLPLIATVCVVLLVLGWWRTAAIPTVMFSITVGTIAGLSSVQSTGAGSPVAITLPGPLTTTVGAALALLSALGILVSFRRNGTAPKSDEIENR